MPREHRLVSKGASEAGIFNFRKIEVCRVRETDRQTDTDRQRESIF